MDILNVDETPICSYNVYIVLKEFVDANYSNAIFTGKGIFPSQAYTDDDSPACCLLMRCGYDIVSEPNRYVLYFARHNNPSNKLVYLQLPHYTTEEYRVVVIRPENIVCLYDSVDKKFITQKYTTLCITRDVVTEYQLNTINAYNNQNVLFEAIKFDTLDELEDINNLSIAKRAYFYIYRNNADLLDYYILEEYQDYIIVAVDSNNIVFVTQ